jgi:hypothetical protein
MAGHYRKEIKDLNGPNNPVEINFKIHVNEKEFSEYLVPAGRMLPFGIRTAFIVYIKGEPHTNISIYEGQWVMQAPESFVKDLGEWIERYCE